ncbi:MAG TPA: 3-hydroxyacyl-ACP dehydratase FabZ [Pirellulaceae bacterium]|nr:3-hydroxyacyl-ACP dehydratase FabZ [Pirellulaceae bacterium]
MDQQEICQWIPHRPPMLLVDRVSEWSETTLRAEKTFRPEEFFFQGHYPEFPLVPGVVLCECAAQAAAVLLAKRAIEAPGVPVLTRLNDVRFKRLVRPGDTLVIDVVLDEQLKNAFYLSAIGRVDQQIAFRLSLACTVAQPQLESDS